MIFSAKPFRSIKSLLALTFFSISTHTLATPAVTIEKAERVNLGISLQGSTQTLPPGTKIWVTVTKINGKKLNEATELADTKVIITADRKFTALLKRHNDKVAYAPPEGTYHITFYSIFNRAWQEVPVLKAVGSKLDEQGRALDGEPHLLPVSSDLVKEDIFGTRVRVLNTTRTMQLKGGATDLREPATKKAVVEINDLNSNKNPIRSFDATNLTANDAIKQSGRLGGGRAMAVLCHGDFKDGLGHRYLANDLVYSSGSQNPEFKVNDYTTIMDVCVSQETSYAARRKK